MQDDDIELDDDFEADEDAEVTASPLLGASGSRYQDVDTEHSIAVRDAIRRQLAADVEAFLAQGGAIATVAAEVRTDLPTKPKQAYGRSAI